MKDLIAAIEETRWGIRVRFEEGEALDFSKRLWREAPLMQVGQEIELEEMKNWLLLHQYQPALHYAVDLLAAQPRAAGEIRRKLRDRKYSSETVEMVLYKLEREKLLDDAGYARHYALSRSHREMGERRIRQALKQKGVEDSVITQALEAVDPEEKENGAVTHVLKLLRRYAGETDERKKTSKLIAAMARRGYSYGETREALERAKERLEQEEETE